MQPSEDWIEEDIHATLVRWARWCRGNFFPASFWLRSGSIERSYLAPAGDVFQSTEESIQKSLGSSEKRIKDPEAMRIEIIVMRLPDRNRDALRLAYVIHKQMAMSEKLRILGVSYDNYKPLVRSSALMVRNRMLYSSPVSRIT